MSGFHGAFATGVACQQGTLIFPDTWLRPTIVGLACAPIVETRFLELVMSLLDFSPRIPLGTSRFCFVDVDKAVVETEGIVSSMMDGFCNHFYIAREVKRPSSVCHTRQAYYSVSWKCLLE